MPDNLSTTLEESWIELPFASYPAPFQGLMRLHPRRLEQELTGSGE